MAEIITDIDKLHQKSTDADVSVVDSLIQTLCKSIPTDARGLAAPQIDEFKRVFIANLSCGRFAFVNPEFSYLSPTKSPSVEACLSLPKITRCVERHTHVFLKSSKAVQWSVDTDKVVTILKEVEEPFELWGSDACIVQHESDHLDGILITDLDSVKSRSEILEERTRARQTKIMAKRKVKRAVIVGQKNQSGAEKKKSKKILNKEKKLAKKSRQRLRRRTEIKERYLLRQEMDRKQEEKSPSST